MANIAQTRKKAITPMQVPDFFWYLRAESTSFAAAFAF